MHSIACFIQIQKLKQLSTSILRHASFPAIYHTDLQYKTLPRENGFIIDHRRDRQILEDGWNPRNTDFRLRFELLDENDIEFISNFVTEIFVKHSNLCRHLSKYFFVVIRATILGFSRRF